MEMVLACLMQMTSLRHELAHLGHSKIIDIRYKIQNKFFGRRTSTKQSVFVE